jgi:hypothetical protein
VITFETAIYTLGNNLQATGPRVVIKAGSDIEVFGSADITGTGTTGTGAGVVIEAPATATQTTLNLATGSLTISGTGGQTSNSVNAGVVIGTANTSSLGRVVLTSGSQAITINGTGGVFDASDSTSTSGLDIGAATIQTSSGNITLIGSGPTSATSSLGDRDGVPIVNAPALSGRVGCDFDHCTPGGRRGFYMAAALSSNPQCYLGATPGYSPLYVMARSRR